MPQSLTDSIDLHVKDIKNSVTKIQANSYISNLSNEIKKFSESESDINKTKLEEIYMHILQYSNKIKEENELEMFLEKPYKNGTKLCHGLLRCQSIKPQREIIHNRDKNAVQNMLKIVDSILKIGKRPDIFCRIN